MDAHASMALASQGAIGYECFSGVIGLHTKQYCFQEVRSKCRAPATIAG